MCKHIWLGRQAVNSGLDICTDVFVTRKLLKSLLIEICRVYKTGLERLLMK